MGLYCEIHIVYSSYGSFSLHRKVYRCLHHCTGMSLHGLWLKVHMPGPEVNKQTKRYKDCDFFFSLFKIFSPPLLLPGNLYLSFFRVSDFFCLQDSLKWNYPFYVLCNIF